MFLQGAHVVDRLQAKQPTRVLEVGFGLGLNCLLCADVATQNRTTLHYTSIEHDLISAAQMRELNYQQHLQQPELADALINVLDRAPTTYEYGPVKLGEYVALSLHITDATSTKLLETLAREPAFDAIFLDAFSPEHNPECWTEAFFVGLRKLLTSDGYLATYCVKGEVRRSLQSAGFRVEKFPGPAGKREVLRAQLEH